jgi:hypothetical protein
MPPIAIGRQRLALSRQVFALTGRPADDLAGLRGLARTLADIDPGMRWHLNAFQPRYRWRDRPPQAVGLLVTATGSAYARGLRHVYVGPAPGGRSRRSMACALRRAAIMSSQAFPATADRVPESTADEGS